MIANYSKMIIGQCEDEFNKKLELFTTEINSCFKKVVVTDICLEEGPITIIGLNNAEKTFDTYDQISDYQYYLVRKTINISESEINISESELNLENIYKVFNSFKSLVKELINKSNKDIIYWRLEPLFTIQKNFESGFRIDFRCRFSTLKI
jgi:hypothetical protein